MTAIQHRPEAAPLALAQPGDFSREQIELIKETVAKGTTDLELRLFLEVCRSTGLNPFLKQVYAIKRRSRGEEKMTIQTGIDGYRLIASRTGTHLGTSDVEFGPEVEGYPSWARVVVKRLVMGVVAEFPATARWTEYVQTKEEWANNRPTGKKTVTEMWARMPHTMLGKCAEALALRKAFPAELSGVYSDVEMEQADSEPRDRSRDVAAQIAREAGVQAQALPDPNEAALQAWASKIGTVGARLKELGLRDEAAGICQGHDWRHDVDAARACYEALVALGTAHKSRQEATEVPAVALITDAQRKALMGHLGRVGIPDSSEARAAFYAWFSPASVSGPTRTNDLTEEQAQGLLEMLGQMDASECEALKSEFERAQRKGGAA